MSLLTTIAPAVPAFADIASAVGGTAPALRASPHPIALVPFVLLLFSIALLPLIPRTRHWWESNLHKFLVAGCCGAAGIGFIALNEGAHAAWHASQDGVAEFLPFIVLLLSLYVIAGGILVTGLPRATPTINTGLLALGAVLANVLGTTGASMLLIRPLLRANRGRTHRAHVVIFFIFVVSNIGGLLLPIGDPPLFLGYLRGVPFSWTLQLAPQWAFVLGAVLTIFHGVDAWYARREPPVPEPIEPETLEHRPEFRVGGGVNVIWLAGVILAAIFLVPGEVLETIGATVPVGARETVMLACTAGSVLTTPRALRRENHFTMSPIIEVAALFSGLFLAMQPALELLTLHAGELGLHSPAQLFWSSGLLSSFLDNAPTYVVFADVASVVTPVGAPGAVPYAGGIIAPHLLAAVSCGAVFMGANTYIGNGPNLMVAAIAHEEKVQMPTFFGYMLWSGAVLLPVFAVATLLFFWG